MREMWDYKSWEHFSGKTKDVSEMVPERSKNIQSISKIKCELCGGNHEVFRNHVSEMVPERPKNIQSISKIECELCGGNHEADQCPHERRFSSEINITSPDRKDQFPNGKSRSVDYSKPQWRWPSIWRPTQSVNGRMNLEGCQCTKNKLTLENLLELGPGKNQLEMGHRQILPDPKTKAWDDEQNKINIEKTLGYGRSYDEARDTMHPDPQFDVEPPVKSQKKGTAVALEKEKGIC